MIPSYIGPVGPGAFTFGSSRTLIESYPEAALGIDFIQDRILADFALRGLSLLIFVSCSLCPIIGLTPAFDAFSGVQRRLRLPRYRLDIHGLNRRLLVAQLIHGFDKVN